VVESGSLHALGALTLHGGQIFLAADLGEGSDFPGVDALLLEVGLKLKIFLLLGSFLLYLLGLLLELGFLENSLLLNLLLLQLELVGSYLLSDGGGFGAGSWRYFPGSLGLKSLLNLLLLGSWRWSSLGRFRF
jgi:hypothetical protein